MGSNLQLEKSLNLHQRIISYLKAENIDRVITVPCKTFANFLDALKEEEAIQLVWPSREEEGIGILGGYHMGGKRAIMVIQNSGFGNMINALKSFGEYYQIPFFALVSHRGSVEEKIEAQKPMGEATPGLLDFMKIKHDTVSKPSDAFLIEESLKKFYGEKVSRVVLMQPSFWREEP